MSAHLSNVRPEWDQVLIDIVDYVTGYEIKSPLAYETARNCLIDTLGCGLEARNDPLARLQRHLARRRMGPSVRQSRRHLGRGRLAVAQCACRRQKAADDEGCADRNDQGA